MQLAPDIPHHMPITLLKQYCIRETDKLQSSLTVRVSQKVCDVRAGNKLKHKAKQGSTVNSRAQMR